MTWAELDRPAVFELLNQWRGWAEQHWYDLPGVPGLGCFGTGYNAWGVQTNQKYASAMAVLGCLGEAHGLPAEDCAAARERALAALRFSLRSHVSGDLRCTDGTAWGRTWISSLGLERMMHGVLLLDPWLTDADRDALRRVLVSEAGWIADEIVRGKIPGVIAGLWASSGRNVPESNIWNGAILWRTAALYPDEPAASHWRTEAHRNLLNGVSIPADADDDTVVAGQALRNWHVGANFFPNYALDHHGYLNVGYQVICLSNAAMLHFDLQAMEAPAPESLHHHQGDLWQVVRRFLFADGRLARLGGDSRVRYAYCQEYLLPALAYAADQFGDRHAAGLAAAQLGWSAAEAAHHGEGSFYGRRLELLAWRSPYYLTRLESDRACALGQLACYSQQVREPGAPAEAFEASVAGGWAEPEHGAVFHRSPRRLVSVAWRAYGLTQALCQPPDDGRLCEWSQNLAGEIRALGDEGAEYDEPGAKRRLESHGQATFPGGFVTWGTVREGCGVALAEGWTGAETALHHLVWAALPDDQTLVGLQWARAVDHRVYLAAVKGLRLNVPADVLNHFAAEFTTAAGTLRLHGPAAAEEGIDLRSRWAVVNGRLAVVGLRGADSLLVDRVPRRRGGKYESLFCEQLCYGHRRGPLTAGPGETLLEVAWAVVSEGTATAAATLAAGAHCATTPEGLRTVRLPGQDGEVYWLAAAPDDAPGPLTPPAPAGAQRLGSGESDLRPGEAGLWRL